MEENASMGRKIEQMREHIEHIVDDGRGLEQSMEEETAKKIRLKNPSSKFIMTAN